VAPTEIEQTIEHTIREQLNLAHAAPSNIFDGIDRAVVNAKHSISAGARAIGITYKAAWDGLAAMTNLFGKPLLVGRAVLSELSLKGLQPPAGAPDPVRQSRAVDLDAEPGEDLALSIKAGRQRCSTT
jgi:hypothetical protein